MDYLGQTLLYLESLDYPALILEFDEYQVAATMGVTIKLCEVNGFSPRMCAIIIWSMTMNYQILPLVASATKH